MHDNIHVHVHVHVVFCVSIAQYCTEHVYFVKLCVPAELQSKFDSSHISLL